MESRHPYVSTHTIDTMLEPVSASKFLDPLSALSLGVTSMQFVLQLKTYLIERKRRKKQEQLEQQHQQQLLHNHHLFPHPHVSPMAPPSPMITYIYYSCTYNTISAYPNYNHHAPYMHPASYFYSPPLNMVLMPPHFSHQNGPASYSRSLNASSSITNYDASVGSYASDPNQDWRNLLHGRIELHGYQQAPLSCHYAHAALGMRTGAWAYNDKGSCFNHWMSLQEGNTQRIQSTIAVVDWSKGNIDMFMEIRGAYFRNYRVTRCDVQMFAQLFNAREVFSGEIKEKKLERLSKDMNMVEVRGIGVQSTNSWRSLGICDESEDMQEVLNERKSFMRMVRGAVFGLVCGLYEDPSDLNVEMESACIPGNLDIVRINTHGLAWDNGKRNSCIFSVFSFCDDGWAAQDILLG